MVALETIIQQKQSGEILSNTNIQFIVDGYTSGVISDDEMTTWLIAVFQNGMSHEETLEYTKVMLNSGITLDFSHLNGLVLDKHSTGGVGDKVSIILAPLLAKASQAIAPSPLDAPVTIILLPKNSFSKFKSKLVIIFINSYFLYFRLNLLP